MIGIVGGMRCCKKVKRNNENLEERVSNKMKFVDFFSGVGGFTHGMKLAGHKCIGHCEFDKYAEASYRSMHTITEEQRKYLLTLSLKQRQKEILKDEYLNGEWYANDVCRVIADDIIPVLTPDRINKRQNGRRFKENGEPSFTLTVQDRHGVAIDFKAFSSKTRGQPFRYGHTACLDHNCYQGVVTTNNINAIWSDKYQCYVAIRKLTPKECFRLQGWTDDYFEKAEQFNSNNQLYKQAGNGVTVTVIQDVAERM